jgi:hypothetical protein
MTLYHYIVCIYAKFRYDESHYAESHYVESHYAKSYNAMYQYYERRYF